MYLFLATLALQCRLASRYLGQFVPLTGAKPTIGKVGMHEHVEEDRVEVVVQSDALTDAGSTSEHVEMSRVVEELKRVRVLSGSKKGTRTCMCTDQATDALPSR